MQDLLHDQRIKRKGKKILAYILTGLLILSAIPAFNAFADEGNVIGVSTGEELDEALENATTGTTVKLLADIDAVSSATYSGKTITIDGNGFTIDGQGIEKSAIRFTGTSDITLKNVTIQNCVGNIRYGGGGFSIFRGDLRVENSTFINNTTLQGDGGGVLIDAAGTNGSSFINCTFYGNSAAANGGAISSAGVTEIINCTMIGNTAGTNGGGAFNNAREGNTTVYNSIIVGNSAAAGDDVYKAIDGGTNLVGDAEVITDEDATTTYGITLASAASWLAGAPAGNGHTVPTIALLDAADSPAVDSANPAYAPARDQRGIARDDQPDIGAYELEKDVSDLKNAAKLVADEISVTNPKNIDFTLYSKLAEEDAVNAIEAVFTYDTDYFAASTKIVPTDLDVASVSVNAEKGTISVVIGVVKNKYISFEDMSALAKTTLTVIDGKAPSEAELALKSFKIYSQGKAIDVDAVSSTAVTELTYNSGIPMDVNNDGEVDAADLSLALYYFGAASGDEDWASLYKYADVNGDGKVDMVDIMLIVAYIHAEA